MEYAEIRKKIEDAGGKIEPGMNWTWATFDNEAKGMECFEAIKAHVEHRGFYYKSSINRPGFRFR